MTEYEITDHVRLNGEVVPCEMCGGAATVVYGRHPLCSRHPEGDIERWFKEMGFDGEMKEFGRMKNRTRLM